MSYETIVVEKDGPLTTITLNRPDRLNAMPPQMADEIGAAFYDLGDSRAVLITGAGKGFCSGADLAARGEGSALQNKGGSHRALQNHYNPAINQVLRADVPVICAVNGPAAGVGCSLALAGDFVLAGKSAYFLQAFANIGLVPDGGATWILPRVIGWRRAVELSMMAERLPAETALEWGLINRVVDDEVLMTEAMQVASKLANGPYSLGLIRQAYWESFNNSYAEQFQLEANLQDKASSSKDNAEGVKAFLEKREAKFTGN